MTNAEVRAILALNSAANSEITDEALTLHINAAEGSITSRFGANPDPTASGLSSEEMAEAQADVDQRKNVLVLIVSAYLRWDFDSIPAILGTYGITTEIG